MTPISENQPPLSIEHEIAAELQDIISFHRFLRESTSSEDLEKAEDYSRSH